MELHLHFVWSSVWSTGGYGSNISYTACSSSYTYFNRMKCSDSIRKINPLAVNGNTEMLLNGIRRRPVGPYKQTERPTKHTYVRSQTVTHRSWHLTHRLIGCSPLPVSNGHRVLSSGPGSKVPSRWRWQPHSSSICPVTWARWFLFRFSESGVIEWRMDDSGLIISWLIILKVLLSELEYLYRRRDFWNSLWLI